MPFKYKFKDYKNKQLKKRKLIILILFAVLIVIIAALIFARYPYLKHSKERLVLKQLIDASQTIQNETNKAFVRPPLTKNLECNRFFANDQNYINDYKYKRIKISDPDGDFPMNCSSIRSRHYFPSKPASETEANYPIAEARAVFQDYIFLEYELAANYAPQNWYCYAIDAKSNSKFYERMNCLASCFPNVFVLSTSYLMDSGGHNLTTSYMECLNLLHKKDKLWKYAIFLQNHEVSVKTNAEIVQIFKWMNGANDVEALYIPKGRVNNSLDWSFEALHIFRNKTLNTLDSPNGFSPVLISSKGSASVSLSREMVNFVINTLDLTEYLKRIEASGYGTDEIMFPTLNAADALQVPGGFTHVCLDNGIFVPQITKFTNWLMKVPDCSLELHRHDVCVFGVENLNVPLSSMAQLFANKMVPAHDLGAIACWYEEMFRRSHLENKEKSLSRLKHDFYNTMPQIEFQRLKKQNGSGVINLKEFNCRWKYFKNASAGHY